MKKRTRKSHHVGIKLEILTCFDGDECSIDVQSAMGLRDSTEGSICDSADTVCKMQSCPSTHH